MTLVCRLHVGAPTNSLEPKMGLPETPGSSTAAKHARSRNGLIRLGLRLQGSAGTRCWSVEIAPREKRANCPARLDKGPFEPWAGDFRKRKTRGHQKRLPMSPGPGDPTGEKGKGKMCPLVSPPFEAYRRL